MAVQINATVNDASGNSYTACLCVWSLTLPLQGQQQGWANLLFFRSLADFQAGKQNLNGLTFESGGNLLTFADRLDGQLPNNVMYGGNVGNVIDNQVANYLETIVGGGSTTKIPNPYV